jgi:seryl-tRNA synthetase
MRADLAATHGVACHADGQVTLSGPLLRLERDLDTLFLAWAAALGAVEYRFPPVIAARELARIDYFASFPHLATFPVSLPAEDAAIRTFTAAHAACREDDALPIGAVAPVRAVLTPAACYPVYVHLQERVLDAVTYVSTRGTCFRRESHYAPFARQWAFSMREIVCLGTRDEVVAFVERARASIDMVTAAIDLPVAWQDATDSFFAAPPNSRQRVRRLAPTKREIVFDGRLALGSVNMHGRRFGEAFHITRECRPAFSACVAFGLERWMLAVLECFGPRPDQWPDFGRHHGV